MLPHMFLSIILYLVSWTSLNSIEQITHIHIHTLAHIQGKPAHIRMHVRVQNVSQTIHNLLSESRK